MGMSSVNNGKHEFENQYCTEAYDAHFTSSTAMPIAIVGMACRFPGDAANVKGLWDMCCEGRSAWTEIPQSRMTAEAFFHPDPSRTGSVCKSTITLPSRNVDMMD